MFDLSLHVCCSLGGMRANPLNSIVSASRMLVLFCIGLLLFKPTYVMAMSCSSIVGIETVVVESAASKMLGDFTGRATRLEYILENSSPQALRQVKKLRKNIVKKITVFEKEGELSEGELLALMGLLERFEKLEDRFVNVEFAQMLAPTDLGRYLHTEEPLLSGVEYDIDLPGLGPTKVKISKEVSKSLSFGENARNTLFPYLFNGLVAKSGQDGLKTITGAHASKVQNGVVYRLVELKNIANSGARIIGIYSDKGELYLYKYITNHHRVDYISKENFLGNFLDLLERGAL